MTDVQSKSELIWLTPEMAATLLTKGAPNRAVRKDKVNEYARDMARGKWEVTGESIAVDTDGRLIQGQHRCLAVVQSGMAIQTYFTTGIASKAIHAMDRGIRRTVGDVIYMNSEGLPAGVARIIAAMLQHLSRWKATGSIQSSMRSNTNLTAGEGLELMGQISPEVMSNSARIGMHLSRALDTPAALMGTLHFILTGIDESDCNFFFDALSKGTGLDSNDPIWVLRERLLTAPQRGKYRQEEKAALIIKAWNAYRHGDKLSRLSWSPGRETFPKPA